MAYSETIKKGGENLPPSSDLLDLARTFAFAGRHCLS